MENTILIEKQIRKFTKMGYICDSKFSDSTEFVLIVKPRVPAVTSWVIFKSSLEETYAEYYESIKVDKCSSDDENYSYFVTYKFKDMPKVTKKKHVINKLSEMEVGDKFHVPAFILLHWRMVDYFTRRSFDVFFSQAKKEFPERKYRCIEGEITRLE